MDREKKERNDEMIREYLAGVSQADLARKYSITPARVRQIIERHFWRTKNRVFRGDTMRDG